MTPSLRTIAHAAIAVLALAAGALAPTRTAEAAVIVDGAGSTWSQIAVDQWRADVARQGLTINYQGVGSSAGRVAYYQGQVDFAVSEIPFQDGREGGVDEIRAAAGRPYAYLPIVAGGTAFMYNLNIGGQRVKDLRLTPATVSKIFTGEIKNWNDPAISSENGGKVFPSLPIKVVIRSDGSGTSAQFTAYMASQAPAVWNAFCQRAGLGASCPATSLYPNPASAGFAAQQFSDGVANFVAAPYNNGAITYVEYGYAKQRGFPVASIANKAGFYAQPAAQNVSIALQGAKINSDGTQNLKGVYEFADPRTYPVSSYSYMIVPTTEAGPFNAEEGDQLGRYILYFLCAGQQKAEQLGYSPLPKNLVEVGFAAVKRIPGAPTPPALARCANPTVTGDFITGQAPPPDDDDRVTPAKPNSQAPGGAPNLPGAIPGAAPGTPGGGPAAESGGATTGATTAGGDAALAELAAEEAALAAASGTGAAALDPFSAAGSLGGAAATAQPIEPGGKAGTIPALLYVLLALTAIAGVFGLPLLGDRLDRRERSR